MVNKLVDPKGTRDSRHYQAYGIDEQRQNRLRILPLAGNQHAPSYDYLMDVVFNGQFGTEEIELVFICLRVKIAGCHLQGLSAAIRKRTCTFIREYHPKHFSSPDPDAPVITRIEVIMSGEIELLLARGKTKH